MTTPEPRTLHDKYLKEAGYYIMSPAETAKALTFKILELAEEKQKVAVKDAEIARLREAVAMIAKQKLSCEFSDDEADAADWLEGYDGCVELARAALNNGGLS